VHVGDSRVYLMRDGLLSQITKDDTLVWYTALIRLALQHDSQDSITCIVADVVEGTSGYNIALLTGAAGHDAMLVGG
jgi:serine/threonine protein phosphatase PrpC